MLRKFLLTICSTIVLFASLLPLHAQNETTPCGAAPAAFGESTIEIESGEQTRRFLLYLPATYDPASPTPLILSFHGFASSPAQQVIFSQWNDLADEHGFVLIYPAGTGFPLRWNNGGEAVSRSVPDDVTFVSDVIDRAEANFCIDPARIYVNGLSAGAGMSNLLACTLADRIAAMGGVAGAYTLPVNGCEPSRPVPIIAFHGTEDTIVPYTGLVSDRFDLPAVNDWAAEWAARNGCDATPETLPATPEVSGIQYTGCDENAEVILYTIQGGGHTWPGGGEIAPAITGYTTQEIDASALMWAFFMQHPLDSE